MSNQTGGNNNRGRKSTQINNNKMHVCECDIPQLHKQSNTVANDSKKCAIKLQRDNNIK